MVIKIIMSLKLKKPLGTQKDLNKFTILTLRFSNFSKNSSYDSDQNLGKDFFFGGFFLYNTLCNLNLIAEFEPK